MYLNCIQMQSWPKLAWVVCAVLGADCIGVMHGPMVEKNNQWLVEGCWAGRYEKGNFDQTDVVFGSGIRLREHRVIFVPSGSTLDRLWWRSEGNSVFVSNSLPALMHAADIDLVTDYDYTSAISTIRHGLEHYQRSIPVSKGTLNVQYFHNLEWDGTRILEVQKPSSTDGFHSFEDYSRFLADNADKLGANAVSSGRRYPVKTLTTVSQGYDSLVGAVLAKQYMACDRSVTIKESSSMWRGSDSGFNIAKVIGIQCAEYSRKVKNPLQEDSFWAVGGKAMELNWAQFDYPEPLCLFVTGVHGDKVWDRKGHDITKPFARPSISGMGLCEYRLIKGIFHCPVPYLGLRYLPDIRRISQSDEMRPWRVGGTYDRPIARRILEGEGIPRRMFGLRKMNTQVAPYLLWPYGSDAQKSAFHYANKRGISVPSPTSVRIWRPMAQLERLIFKNIVKRIGFKERKWPWSQLAEKNILFQWGNEHLKSDLAKGLQSKIVLNTDPKDTNVRQSNSSS